MYLFYRSGPCTRISVQSSYKRGGHCHFSENKIFSFRTVLQVLWSQELAYLTVVLEDSVTKDQIQRLDPPVGDFPKLDPSKQVDETKI